MLWNETCLKQVCKALEEVDEFSKSSTKSFSASETPVDHKNWRSFSADLAKKLFKIMTAVTASPMMAQWETLKNSVPHAILLFRLGDFYEAFHDDALLIAKELDITLTKRQEIPMAGVPSIAAKAI